MQRLLIILIALSIVVAVTRFGFIRASQSDEGTLIGQITVSSLRIDFGEIDPLGGPVSTTIEVANTGEGSLQINRISTSCGCTTATMDSSALEPGQTRPLTIQFDPQVHPDEEGPIARVVYIQSSDPDQPEIEIDVVGTLLSRETL